MVQKDDKSLGANESRLYGRCVTALTPVVPQSPDSDVQCRSSIIIPCISSFLRFVYIAFLSHSRRLQYDDVFLKLNKQYSSHVSEHGSFTLLTEGTTLNLVTVGDSLCSIVLKLALSPVDSDEPSSH